MLFFILITHFVFAALTPYELLEHKRSDIIFPEYTSQEKQDLLEVSRNLFYGFNSNQFVKEEHFQNELAVSILFQEIENNVSISTEELLSKLYEIYYMQYDDHMNFGFPAPHSCYTASTPIVFAPSTDNKIYVSSTFTGFSLPDSAVENSIKQTISRVQLGDELIEIDQTPIQEYIQQAKDSGIAPTNYYKARVFIKSINYKNLRYRFKPQNNSVSYILERPDGSRYSVEFPWMVKSDSNCLSNKKKDLNPKEVFRQLDLGIDDEANIFTEQKSLINNKSLQYIEEFDYSLGYGWGYITHHSKKYAYFKLGSFSPSLNTNIGNIRDQNVYLEHFRKIWGTLNNDPNVKGIIFDIRNNGGGSLALAYKILQSFIDTPITTTRYRLKNTPLNLAFYRHAVDTLNTSYLAPQKKYIEEVAGGSEKHTNIFPLYAYSDLEANISSRRFYKPVIVFTNERCYSACDAFSALVQDHHMALIAGEDLSTGGGGANVWSLSFFNTFKPSSTFGLKELPYKQNIRVPFRSFVRGLNSNQTVEDEGVIADLILPPSRNDIAHSSKEQFLSLTNIIDSQYQGNYPIAEMGALDLIKIPITHTQELSWKQAHLFELGMPKNEFSITDQIVETKGSSSYANHLSTQIVFPLNIKSPSLSKAIVDIEVKSEACCDKLYIMTETDGVRTFHSVYSGDINTSVEIPLPQGEVLLYFWVTSDWAEPEGKFKLGRLRIQ